MKMKTLLRICMIAMLQCFIIQAFAQELQISGKVSSKSTGEILVGASVKVKESTTGVSTDAKGNYSLSVPAGSTIVISHTGMTAQERLITQSGTYDFVLDALPGDLEEVVVVGYGTQKRREVTGAISRVNASDLENMPVFRVENSMQGRIAGVQVAVNSGQPGSAAQVRIRGVSSIGANTDPIYVVDGVVINGGIDFLNQADIESIDVLKDAASAAIYGTQASNGVILITTKKGKRGDISVSYNGYVGTQAPWRKLNLMNAEEYATLINESLLNGGQSIRFSDPKALGVGTDWQSLVFNDNAFIQNHELSLSGSNEKSSYYGSFGFLDQEGIVATSNSKWSRFTARFNTVHNINKAITFGTNIGYTRSWSVGVGTNTEWGSPLNRAINLDPLTPAIVTDPSVIGQAPYTNSPYIVRDANGNPYGISTWVTSEILNPLAALKIDQSKGWSDKIVANGFLEISPVKGLKFRSQLGTDLAFWGYESFQPLYYLNSINQNVDLNGYTRETSRGMFWMWENTLSYTYNTGMHSITGLVGTAAQKNYGESNGGTKRGIPVDNLKDASLGFSVPQTNQYFWGGEYQGRLASIFGRINYNFDGRYLVQAILRRDGSARFGSNNKFGLFPSVSVGWVASRESFWNSDKISFLKIRASYGENGNDRIGDFRYLSTVGGGRNYTVNGELITGFSPNAMSNPDLKWETTAQIDIGFDAVLFKNFNLTVDWFNKKTYDLLLTDPVPGYVGTGSPVANIGDMKNSGFEVELGYKNRLGNVDFNIAGNVAYLKNEIVYLGRNATFLPNSQNFGPQGVEFARITLGYPIHHFYGFKTDGLFQNQSDINSHVNKDGDLLQPLAKPGDIRFIDYNGDGVLNNDDRTFIGDPTPTWSYGFTATAAWKGVDVTLFGQGVGGNEIFQALRRFDLQNANYTGDALGRWTGEGSSNYYPRLNVNDAAENQNFSRSSDFYVQKGDYFRIKTFQVGYSFKNAAIRKAGLDKLRLYVMANNLFTLTKYNGYDPEMGGSGVDRGIYPQARTLMVGINLGF